MRVEAKFHHGSVFSREIRYIEEEIKTTNVALSSTKISFIFRSTGKGGGIKIPSDAMKNRWHVGAVRVNWVL